VGPRASLDRCGKSHPHRDSIPGPSSQQPVGILTKLCGPILQTWLWHFLPQPGLAMSHAGGTTNLYVKVYSATGTGSGLVAMLYAMYDAYGIKTTEEVENNN